MAFFQSAEEKAANRESAAARKAEQKARDARERYLKSPLGLARTAHEREDSIFQIALVVDEKSTPTLSQIEQIGWRLDESNFVHELKISSTNYGGDRLQEISSSGVITGIYIFRRSIPVG